MIAAMEFAQASADLYEEKRRCPVDDVMSVWTHAEIQGEPLPVEAVISDSLLVLDGGAETTRTVIARTILNLIERPDQWEVAARRGRPRPSPPRSSSGSSPRSTTWPASATRDHEIGGATIRAGQQAVLMYSSANRDETHFTDPDRLDVTRNPNNHLSFGFGTHFCLGAALARLEIRVFFEELVRRVSAMRRPAGTEIVEMPNAFVYGLKSAPVAFEFLER